ncbi:fibronectin type III domain [Eubacterium sp. CAG:38]|nr:fibronectin type III domain [Eubacterium sp. CAG:38]
MTTNTVVPFMTYAYADTANIRAGAVTVTSESQLRQALQAGSSLIVVSGSITVAEDAAGTPLMIPGNVTITGADSSSELIIRGAVQLTGDHVTIQNVKLHFISTNALQSVVHREIFLAGHSLVLDSVDTYVKGGAGSGLGGFGGTEEELLPTVYAGGFKNTVVGQNASLTVTNAVENTKIQAVYMSHDSGSDGKTAYTGSAEVYADAKTVIREGIHTENNSCADITLKGMGESIIASAKIKDFYGNENTSLTLQKCSVDGNIQNVENVILDDEAELCLVSGSLKNIEVKNKASLNLTEYDESIFVEIKGNFTGNQTSDNIADGYIVLKKDNQVIIDKDVTGTTKAAVGNKLFPSVFTEGYTYITAQGKAAKESFAPAKAGWFFKYTVDTQSNWTATTKQPEEEDLSVGRLVIQSAPQTVNINRIFQKEDGSIPDDTVYFDIDCYNSQGVLMDGADVTDWLGSSVLVMKTSLWESEDAESLNETNWGEAVALVTDGENYPNRYFLEAYPGAKTGTYTFLFFPNGYDEGDIETVGAVKAQKDKIFAECTVEFTDKDIEPVQKHQVIVGNGTGSGEYAAGDIVTITAAGAAQGMAFDRWAGNTALDFTENTDSHSATAVFIMPDGDVEINAEYKDISAPTGEITVSTNKWNVFCNAVTFGKFFKERQEVGIHADDLGLGIDKVFYLISEEAKTLEEVQNIQASDWTVYEQRFAIDPDKKCIVYVKITDKGGNTAYLSTDGLVFDGSSPVISGVKHNETYGGSVQFTVNDDNLDYVEIDGVLAGRENGGYTVTDVEGAHTITAVDKAGNRTQVSVTIVHATQPTTESTTEAPKPTEGTTEAPKPTQKPTEAPTEVTKPTEKPTEAPTQKPETDEKVIYEMRQDADGNWHYYANDTIAADYCGMAVNEYGWWYIKNGDVDFTYTGMACNEYGWWYFNNGQLDTTFYGLANNEYGTWFYTDGQLNFGFTGMIIPDDEWLYVQNGQVLTDYTGMALNDYGWWYFNNGRIDFVYIGMAANEYGWWYFNNGQIDFGYNGFAANEYGTWLFTNGILNTGFTGMTLNGGTWVYVTDGYISDTYTGMALNEYGWWYFNNGTLDFNYTGMALNEYGWWYFKNGQLDLGFTGIGSNEYGDWFFKDGRIAFEYTGSYNDGGQWYMVNSGFASKI